MSSDTEKKKPARKKAAAKKATKSFEQTLWDTADKLRGSVESSEYKHVVLSLIFLKFISDKFEAQRQKLVEGCFGVVKRERKNNRKDRTLNRARADVFNYFQRFHNPRRGGNVAAQDRKFTPFLKPSVETG